MEGRQQVQISVVDPRFNEKITAVALQLGPSAYARGKASRSRVLALILNEAYLKTPQGRREKEIADVLDRKQTQAEREDQVRKQTEVFTRAIHAPEAWVEGTGRIDRNWVREQFGDDHVKAIAGSDWSKVAILLSIGEGCSNGTTMKLWLEQHYNGGGYRGIADLLTEKYVPVAHMTVKRFADSLEVQPRKSGPRGNVSRET